MIAPALKPPAPPASASSASHRHDLLARYGERPLPRYTSYPPANLWPEQSGEFARAVFASVGAAGDLPVSLYVHVPFCKSLCWYCGCNMMVTHSRNLVERYLAALEKEVVLVTGAVAGGDAKTPPAVQLHLGGGTPTHLDEDQLTRLVAMIRRAYTFTADAELSIEIHPSVTTVEQVRTLARLGFNRLSVGIQDFDPAVQDLVNRHQSFEHTQALIETARAEGFTGINVDLMYGLPGQTPEGFARTLDLLDTLAPDRIALFGYAHMPRLKKHHRLIRDEDLPRGEDRLALLEAAIATLTARGYEYVGLDHFARKGDSLVAARRAGTLRRNFMGYTTQAESAVLAFGPSSISEVCGAFVQNERSVGGWLERVEAGELPVVRGWLPTEDDDARRAVMQDLFCQLALDPTDVEHPALPRLLAAARPKLAPLVADGLVNLDETGLHVTPTGQLFLRNVAAVFDAYLDRPKDADGQARVMTRAV
jgi:oxygen-independent coproporphyrinogen III oxidase